MGLILSVFFFFLLVEVATFPSSGILLTRDIYPNLASSTSTFKLLAVLLYGKLSLPKPEVKHRLPCHFNPTTVCVLTTVN